MIPPKFKVRTLLIGVAVLAVLLEIGGLGQRSPRYATKARGAADLVENNRGVVNDAKIDLARSLEEAARIAAKEPARAAALRLIAERLTRGIPFLEGEAIRAARAKVIFERAMTHPWEGDPPDDHRLDTTAPVD